MCLDLGYVIKQKFQTKQENKENISVPSDVITSEVPTDEVFSNKDTTSTSAPISIKEEEALFTKRYVAEAHKNSHIYEIIKSMEDIGHGGQFFVRVLRIAKTLGWIHMIPPYKDALMIFGESFIGKESNYNTQLNNDDSDEEKKYEIRKTLKNKFDCVQNKYPKEVPSTNES